MCVCVCVCGMYRWNEHVICCMLDDETENCSQHSVTTAGAKIFAITHTLKYLRAQYIHPTLTFMRAAMHICTLAHTHTCGGSQDLGISDNNLIHILPFYWVCEYMRGEGTRKGSHHSTINNVESKLPFRCFFLMLCYPLHAEEQARSLLTKFKQKDSTSTQPPQIRQWKSPPSVGLFTLEQFFRHWSLSVSRWLCIVVIGPHFKLSLKELDQ